MLDLGLAIGHHLLLLALIGILAAELVLVTAGMDDRAVARTVRIDLCYGVVAATILAIGFARVLLAAKGWDYYQQNPFFWAKIATFLLIGLLSVPPTMTYLRWRRRPDAPPASEVANVRRYLLAELALFPLLAVFAAAMARGHGA